MISEATKACNTCREEKPLSDFNRNGQSPDGRRHKCKGCQKDYMQQWRKTQPDYARGYWLRTQYGLTPRDWQALFDLQGGCCAVCGEVPSDARAFHVDHDHACCSGDRSCGKCVRGLLCTRCNTGLGMFKDDPARLSAAVDYLVRGVA